MAAVTHQDRHNSSFTSTSRSFKHFLWLLMTSAQYLSLDLSAPNKNEVTSILTPTTCHGGPRAYPRQQKAEYSYILDYHREHTHTHLSYYAI